MLRGLLFSLALLASFYSFAQVDYTANDQVTPYDGGFKPGINFDYYPPYTNEDLANLASGNPLAGVSGIGARTSRPSLRESFAEVWGYDHYVNTFQHFKSVGMKDMTMIVGFPAEWHRDQTKFCDDDDPQHKFCSNDFYTPNCANTMFANLYTPIWDGGANGTPYNDDNYLAAYMYKMVTLYKDDVKFWEIWNEPGFDHSYVQGWQTPGGPNNWWDNDPSPCVNHFKAPIEHFVRTLRVCYDVVKTVDPDAYVCLAGVGFESFLDAVLRNTDNPVDGSVTPEYPLGGGAYFDVMGFHTYPDIDGSVRYWDNAQNQWVYTRNSDAGAEGIATRKNTYAGRLAMYGYDGVTHPKKEWIITEINVPRVKFGAESMASDEVQVNYIIKAMVKAMKLDIRQMHPYQLGDRKKESDATGEFDLLGMYLNFTGTTPYENLVKTNEGIAYKTASDILYGSTFDAAKTAAMNLPAGVEGGAFYDALADGWQYVLWAVTTQDLSEAASATYSFPSSFGMDMINKRSWDYSETDIDVDISTNDIALTGRPIFLLDAAIVDAVLTIVPDVQNLNPINVTCAVTVDDITVPTATAGGMVIEGIPNKSFPITNPGVTTLTWTYLLDNGQSYLQTQTINWNPINTGVSLSTEGLVANSTTAQYQWLDCNDNYAAINGATAQVYKASVSGNYAVEISRDGCVDTSACYSVITSGTLTPSLNSLPKIFASCEVLEANVEAPTATSNGELITGTPNVVFPITDEKIKQIIWTYTDNTGQVITQIQQIEWQSLNTTIAISGNSILSNDANASYQWIDCATNNPIAGATEQVFTPTSTGDYAVQVTNNGCVDTSSCINMVITGLSSIDKNDVEIFPNPTSGLVTIKYQNIKTPRISISDVTGKVLYQVVAIGSEPIMELDMSKYSKGVYILQITSDNKSLTQRIVKE